MKPTFRECYVLIALFLHRFASGFAMAYPAVLIIGLTGDNCALDLCVSKDLNSWIVAIYSITGAISFLILPSIMQLYGRRMMNVTMNLILITGGIIIANSYSVWALLAGRAVQGLGFCGITLNCIIGAEYTHPKTRGYLLTLVGIGTVLGIVVCHSLCFVLSWRQTAYLGTLPSMLGALSTFFMPESPSWLAFKGRYEECTANLLLLRGKECDKELIELISAQKEIKILKSNKRGWYYFINTWTSKDFLKPLAILTCLVIFGHVVGIYYLLAYVIEIMRKLTGDSVQSYYYTMGLDSFKVIALIISSVIIKWCNRRTFLLSSSVIACSLLLFLCIFNYLEEQQLAHSKWATPIILIAYNTVCHIGIIPVYILLISEIFPLEYKSIGISSIGVIYSLVGFVTLKFTPQMLDNIKVYGTFSVYLGIAVICICTLYFILPETKDRTLQNIEFEFYDVKPNEDDCIDINYIIHRQSQGVQENS